MNICLIVFGVICIFYDVILICINPGTFLDILTSFNHIWGVLGVYHIFLGIYRKKTGHSFWSMWKKWVQKVVGTLIGIGGVITIVSMFFILTPSTCKYEEESDYLILLGGGINKYGELPTLVKNRCKIAAKYLNMHPDVICVVTGGTLKWLPYPEAPAIKRELEKNGVESSRILVEDQALDTIQNFQYSCKKLEQFGGKSTQEILDSRIIIVTNYFHLRRAERLASRMGFQNIKGLPAHVGSITIVHAYVREVCAYLKLNLRILFTGKPEKLC